MANSQYIEIIAWNRLALLWSGQAANIRDAVEHAVASGVSLAYANLVNADLANAQLQNADLSQAMLAHANLYRARFDNANMRYAYLAEADLTCACFNGSDITGAELDNAITIKTDFSGAVGYLSKEQVPERPWHASLISLLREAGFDVDVPDTELLDLCKSLIFNNGNVGKVNIDRGTENG